MGKISREKWKTYGNVFDNFTLRNLFKLSSQGHFEELKGTIALGKEANVFTAYRFDDSDVAVKIYRLENCDFNKMYSYIKTDPRFANLKSQKRKIIFAWTRREFQNLMRAREVGVRVPTPLTFYFNIIVMELLGDSSGPAPLLKDSMPENPEDFLDKVIDYYRKLYHNAQIIHGDLSEFNILNFNESPVFIDFSQATPRTDPNAHEYFDRDVRNLSRFFSKIGLELTKDELHNRITKTS